MFENINFEVVNDYGQLGISASTKSRALGILEYSLPDQQGGLVSLSYIEADSVLPGIGGELLRRFVAEIGRGRLVKGGIIHKGTVNWFARNGFYNGVSPTYSRLITEPQTLDKLPFKRFLDRAGVKLLSIGTTYNERDFNNGDTDFPYRTRFTART